MKNLVCTYCGGTEMVRGQQDGQGAIRKSGWALSSQFLYHDICAKCGTVVRSFVEKPEKLR
ncbi:hypothetical protein EAF07_04845 [Streptococcus hillyeri]|uniref:Uncharacterized protein n=2 Tax=Streptococcus hillyeri TaxID=2282420 RepID=A0A3L9DQN9_9STRE|nr:hypothetical protein EAF07_04845 [Streptococcus hillyeri]